MSTARGLVVQWEVVSALVLRETRTRFGDSKLGYLWALLQPLLVIGSFFVMFALGRSRPGGTMDTVAFLATGLLGYDLVVHSMEQASRAIAGNQALLVHPRVKVLDLVIARVTLEALTTFLVFAVIMTGNALYLGRIAVDSPLRVMIGLLLATWLGGSLGLAFCALSVLSSSVDRVRAVVMRPLFFLSGVFYTADGLPLAFRDVLVWNPILHTVEVIRSGWFGSYESRVASPVYVVGWCLGLSALGLLLERAVRTRVGAA